MFGAECTKTVTENYPDAFVSAHLEVPGEMFEIAMEKSISGKGVVGSTADILNFIKDKVAEAAEAVEAGGKPPAGKKNLQFVLGTEAGMVTSIVNNVQVSPPSASKRAKRASGRSEQAREAREASARGKRAGGGSERAPAGRKEGRARLRRERAAPRVGGGAGEASAKAMLFGGGSGQARGVVGGRPPEPPLTAGEVALVPARFMWR
jgi:hypothetical protein